MWAVMIYILKLLERGNKERERAQGLRVGPAWGWLG